MIVLVQLLCEPIIGLGDNSVSPIKQGQEREKYIWSLAGGVVWCGRATTQQQHQQLGWEGSSPIIGF